MNSNSSVDKHDRVFASVIIATNVLSLVGSGAIILTYIIFRELRTTMRCLLVHLSLANFISSLTNLIGAVYHLTCKYYPIANPDVVAYNISYFQQWPCQAQSIISLYGFEASVLWTIVFIVYMYLLIACCRPTPLTNTVVLIIVSLATWIVPIPIVIAFAVMKVGLNEIRNCYSPAFYASSLSADTIDMEIMEIIGYKVFLYLSFVVLPILTVIFIVHLCYIKRHHNLFGYDMSHYSRVIRTAELKLVLVPIFYLVLKIFPLTVDIFIWLRSDENLPLGVLMIAFIGDSGQGFLNGVLFILFTKSARDKVFSRCFACCCCCFSFGGNSLESERISNYNTPSTFSYRMRKRNSKSINTAVQDSDYILRESSLIHHICCWRLIKGKTNNNQYAENSSDSDRMLLPNYGSLTGELDGASNCTDPSAGSFCEVSNTFAGDSFQA